MIVCKRIAKRKTHKERLRELFTSRHLVRARELEPLGIPRVYLKRLQKKGVITRIDCGLYELVDAPLDAWSTLAEVCRRIPKATICLLSALHIHNLTTQSPHKVWIASPKGTHHPRTDIAHLEIVYMRDHVLPTSSIETLRHKGAEIRVTTPAKTVADCFKFRDRVGKDVALEALKDYLHNKGDVRKLIEEADRDHVTPLIQPVVEGLLA